MTEMMVRVESENFENWLKNHRSGDDQRRAYGMTDRSIYRDVEDPSAAFVHIHVDDLGWAMQWFQTEEFKESTRQARVTRREFYRAEKQGLL